MNVAFFLTPKSTVAYLYDHFTIRQGLEKMKYHGYTAIPVITKEGKYVGTVSEGDFLWHIVRGENGEQLTQIDIKETEDRKIADLPRSANYQPVHITATIDQLIEKAVTQNFVPVIDDLDSFIGIVTRRDIMKHFFISNYRPDVDKA